MFNKLKQRWKVNAFDLVLIICTFAIGGSLCGYLGRQILLITNLEKGAGWMMLYVLLVTILWPFSVLFVSIFLGQFSFFKNYLQKIWGRMSGGKSNTHHIAIFASGTGSNAKKIIEKFNTPILGREKNRLNAKVSLVICNKPGTGVLQIAADAGIETLLIEKNQFLNGDHYLPALRQHKISFIVLAGFLLKIPAGLIQAYPDKIINIHPALLPKHGGKGMYGSKVHEAVIEAGENESGITIHLVDELYDHGKIVFQAMCPVYETDTPAVLAAKIHLLEHKHYPEVIEQLLANAK